MYGVLKSKKHLLSFIKACYDRNENCAILQTDVSEIFIQNSLSRIFYYLHFQ